MNQLSPWRRSEYAHLADLKPAGTPPSADVLMFIQGVEWVRRLIGTGLLSKFSELERIKIGWELFRKSNEGTKH
jgi:hypothetical protein